MFVQQAGHNNIWTAAKHTALELEAEATCDLVGEEGHELGGARTHAHQGDLAGNHRRWRSTLPPSTSRRQCIPANQQGTGRMTSGRTRNTSAPAATRWGRR